MHQLVGFVGLQTCLVTPTRVVEKLKGLPKDAVTGVFNLGIRQHSFGGAEFRHWAWTIRLQYIIVSGPGADCMCSSDRLIGT
jgi:hypothetical protein